ncbi:hypothetical protein [Streptomyces hygroscopicus]|uniref:hypothetical protein n=1 Tax=Streptomyces hygroscopicus TaxID=1912 RepID=UPI00131DAC0A|nr:hypothetical protein [Streptomyces hygroscopicus]
MTGIDLLCPLTVAHPLREAPGIDAVGEFGCRLRIDSTADSAFDARCVGLLVAGLPAVAAVRTAEGGVLGVLVELLHHPLPSGDRAVDGDLAVVLASEWT